ncbi:hypothetical protein [Croceivirga sp. JEA036]|nr:hypothetical protein [Croceivirga sp. JEA036]NJB36489.1 hypothetical protein [Croceivirga sp. JEA036]
MKTILTLPLVSWQNGITMIVVFAVVVVAFILGIYTMINSGQNKQD